MAIYPWQSKTRAPRYIVQIVEPMRFAQAFFLAAALALAAFFLLLRIITMPKKDPTTAEPRRMMMTGMRIAQARGGKKFWSGWS
jgi:hypothetical protein